MCMTPLHLSPRKFLNAELEIQWRKYEIYKNKKYLWALIIARFVYSVY